MLSSGGKGKPLLSGDREADTGEADGGSSTVACVAGEPPIVPITTGTSVRPKRYQLRVGQEGRI